MTRYYADLHIHLGRDGEGRPVKVSASAGLTVRGVVEECSRRKGVRIAGIVDCHSPGVIRDLEELIGRGEARELQGGGIVCSPAGPCVGGAGGDGVTILLASEVEVVVSGARCHIVAYLPCMDSTRGFSSWLKPRVTNINLSSQKCDAGIDEVVEAAARLGGFCVPAHAFTPHRGILGACVSRLSEAFEESSLAHVPAVELGLSADTDMADTIDEMASYTFLSNSDAHSRATIARECNLLDIEAPEFSEVESALRMRDSRRVIANLGLDPRLGKYHRTFCLDCGGLALGGEAAACPSCGSSRVVKGVWDRIRGIASYDHPVHPPWRPPYVHHVPLAFIPGIGPKTLDRIIARFGSEMKALHHTPLGELAQVTGEAVAGRIVAAREGRLRVTPGAGGIYGSVVID